MRKVQEGLTVLALSRKSARESSSDKADSVENIAPGSARHRFRRVRDTEKQSVKEFGFTW